MAGNSEDYKKRVARAMTSYFERQEKKNAPRTRKNSKPEKTVEAHCLIWMRQQGWDVQIFEAKATYDPRRGIWRNQAMKKGTVDCLGNTKDGVGVAIEFKSPGKLSSLRDEQRTFLIRKIETGVFACVVDDVTRLEVIHWHWRELRSKGEIEASKRYLIGMLPKKVRGGV